MPRACGHSWSRMSSSPEPAVELVKAQGWSGSRASKCRDLPRLCRGLWSVLAGGHTWSAQDKDSSWGRWWQPWAQCCPQTWPSDG